jgi:hypothetical protein
MKVFWQPNPGPQTDVLLCQADEILYGGARGGGKTEAGIVWMIEPKYVKNPLYRGLVIRRNAEDLKDWVDRARRMYTPLRCEVTGAPATFKFPSGAEIRTGHLKDDNAYEKYQGHEYQKMLIEELTQIAKEENYEKLWMSNRSTVPGLQARIMATANPGGRGHSWCKRRFVDIAKNKIFKTVHNINGIDVITTRTYIPAHVQDTPQLDTKYIAMLMSLTEPRRTAWLEGNWDIFSGQFFSRWTPAVHVIKPFEIPSHWYRYRGFDWGFAKESAMVWIAVNASGDHYLYREYYAKEQTPSRVAQDVNALNRDEDIVATYADPSIWNRNPLSENENTPEISKKSIADNLIAHGVWVRKANNDRINGWMRMRELLEWGDNRKPKLQVFDTCINTIRTIPEQVVDENNVEDLDTDGEDHICDATRYVVVHTAQPIIPEKKKDPDELEWEQVKQEETETSLNWLDS